MQSTISKIQAVEVPKVSALQEAKRILGTGNTVGARAFVERALLETPDDEKLQAFARLIAPQQVRRVPSSPARIAAMVADRQWLRENEEDYRGQWVVLKGGELIGHGKDLDEIEQRTGSFQGLFIKRIF